MIKFEINVIAYKRLDMVLALLPSFGSNIIRVWDNSPTKWNLVHPFVTEYRWNRFNPSLTRVWNWAIAQSESDWVMICSDDIKLKDGWYDHLQNEMQRNPESLWHGPSRCFIFNKRLLEKVGWFDERLLGITYEDLDYIRRMNHAGVKHLYGTESCLSEDAVSLKQETFNDRSNHPYQNREFFISKYGDAESEKFTGIPQFDTPDFYPNRNVHLS